MMTVTGFPSFLLVSDLLGASSLEERLLQLVLDISRDTLNSVPPSAVTASRKSLEASMFTWRRLMVQLNRTKNIARKRVTSLSTTGAMEVDPKDAVLIFLKLRSSWTVLVILELLRSLTSHSSCSIEEVFELTSICVCDPETFEPKSSGFGEKLAQERAVLLLKNLRDFAVEMFPSLQIQLSNGSNLIEGIKALSLTILTGEHRYLSCYDSLTDIPIKCKSKVALWNGVRALFGLPPIRALPSSTVPIFNFGP